MDVDTTVADLQKALYHPSLFYIPYALFPDLSEESFIELEAMDFFNTLGTLTEAGEVSPFNNKHSFIILTKTTLLRQNIVQLSELKAHVQEATFKLILEDYWSTAKLWEYIYDWLKNNVAEDVPTIDKFTVDLFKLQSEAIKAHLLQLKEQFQLSSHTQPLDRKAFLDRHKNLMPFNQHTVAHIFNNDVQPSSSESITTKFGKRKNNGDIPSIEEVDAYLLDRVFNVGGEKHVEK